MINIKDLYVEINNQKIINGIDLRLPKTGLIGISGPSGCGKTTLLNCLAGLIDFKGEIEINNRKIQDLNEEDKGDFRLENFGFVFQDYKLFENLNVVDNISLTYLATNDVQSKQFKERFNDLLNILNLKNKKFSIVKNLSGGEKQRVAIGRSLINEPPVLLCDEPTGNLDINNSHKIMEILHSVSLNHLVVIVSHDLDILKQYCSAIYFMEDGVIIKDKKYNNEKKISYLKIKSIKKNKKKQKIGFSFLLKYCFSKIKQKQIRSFISASVAALGLMSFGLSFSLTESISSNIKNVYSSSIKDNRIILNQEEESTKSNSIKSIDEEGFEDIRKRYEKEIRDYGYYYYFDFENNFPDANEVVLDNEGFSYQIEGLSIRNFNEFTIIEDEEIFHHIPSYLNNNEVVLGLNLSSILDICYQLRIKRSVESLSDYLAINPINLKVNLANLYWSYEYSINLKMVGFVLNNSNIIYHMNNLFNEYVFEHLLNFPTSNNVYGVLDKPWTLRKIPFIVSDKVDYLLEEALNSKENQKYIFELNFDGKEDKNKIFIFENSLKGLSPYLANVFIDNSQKITKPIFGSSYGHFIYPTMFLMGFSYETFLTPNETIMDELISSIENITTKENESMVYPDGVLQSYFLNSEQNSFIFDVFDNNLYLGSSPKDYSEIVVSTALAKELFDTTEVIGKEIYLSHIIGESITSNDSISRQFQRTSLTISGVVDRHDNAILHSQYWTIIYYQKHLNISRFLLDINSISFEVKTNENLNTVCEEFNSKYKGYNFVNPMKEINSGIDEVCSYVSVALLFFSIITFAISILLMIITNFLHVSENKKDFGLLLVLGIKRNETNKFIYAYSLLVSFISFVLGTLYLFLVNLLINLEISNILKAPLSMSFSLKSLLLMFTVAIVLSIISFIFLNKKISKIRPLDIIK